MDTEQVLAFAMARAEQQIPLTIADSANIYVEREEGWYVEVELLHPLGPIRALYFVCEEPPGHLSGMLVNFGSPKDK